MYIKSVLFQTWGWNLQVESSFFGIESRGKAPGSITGGGNGIPA